MSNGEKIILYKGFVLMCDHMSLDSSGYEASVFIYPMSEDSGQDGNFVVPECPANLRFESAQAALDYGAGWAIQWVDAYTASNRLAGKVQAA